MEVDGLPIKVEAAVSEKLPMGMLLETDVPELSTLFGTEVKLTDGEDDVMVVVTLAHAPRQLEEEILRRKKEIHSGAKPTSLEDSEEPRTSGAKDRAEPSSTGEGLTKKQKRSLQQQLHQSKVQNSVKIPMLDFSAEELREMQQKDVTLDKICEAAEGTPNSAGVEFFFSGGLLYWRWGTPWLKGGGRSGAARPSKAVPESGLEDGPRDSLSRTFGDREDKAENPPEVLLADSF